MQIIYQETGTALQRVLNLGLPARRRAQKAAHRRLRLQAHDMLLSLDALQRDIYIAHYDEGFPERGVDLGAVEIRKLVELGMPLPMPLPRSTQKLHDHWEVSRRMLKEKTALRAVDQAMDDLRADLLRLLSFYR